MTLERQVDPPPPTAAATAGRMALSCLAGAAAVAIAFVARPRAEAPPPSPTPAAPPHITVTAPPPIVVALETVVQSPITPVVAAEALGCPITRAMDEPIGKPVSPRAVERGWSQATVKTAAAAPVIAVQDGGDVWVSEDDGRTWARAFANRGVERIAVAPDGTVYALEELVLHVRARGGKVARRPIKATCSEDARCQVNIGALGDEVVAFIDDRILTSADRGKTWTAIKSETTWETKDDSELHAFRGALYQVNHYTDMCGIDDYHTYRFGRDHSVGFDVFHNYDSGDDEPVLEPSNDFDTIWTWANMCRLEGDQLGRCKNPQLGRREMLQAAWLTPREGGRTLAVYRNSLIELCAGGVRQVYREFPFDHLDAVDASGRALVMNGLDLLRWSPSVGWRKLRTFAGPAVQESE